MEEQDQIVVLRSFTTSMDASIAKTKLDAYGIPCFLTEENISNLYPVQNARLSGVRLHLFLKDAEQASQILNEQISLPDDELTRCPHCRSSRVEIDHTKKLSSRLLSIVATFFFTLFPLKRVYHCLDCDREF